MSRSWRDTLRDLRAVRALARSLEETAPDIVKVMEGGGEVLVRLYGKPTGAGFWALDPFPEGLWEAMALEHARALKGTTSRDRPSRSSP